MNVMESSCGGWTRGSAGGGFLFNPERRLSGLAARVPLKLPICPAPVPRLAPYPLADSCSQLLLTAAPGHGNAPRLSNYSKAAGHRVKYRS